MTVLPVQIDGDVAPIEFDWKSDRFNGRSEAYVATRRHPSPRRQWPAVGGSGASTPSAAMSDGVERRLPSTNRATPG